MADMEGHPGFDAVAEHIAAHDNMPLDQAKKVLAHAAHHASMAAVKKNPRLKRVSGVGRKKAPSAAGATLE